MRGIIIFLLFFFFISPSFFSISFAQNSKDFKKFYLKETEGFEAFKKEDEESFKKYLKELNKEFKEYKRIYQEEFERYKREIARVWEKPEFPTKKKWVEYSSDLKARKSVDFEKGEIEISVIAPSKKLAKRRLKEEFTKFLLEDKRAAYKNDKLMQRVEKRLKTFKYVKEAKVDREPVVSDLIFKKPPTARVANRFSERVVESSSISVSKSKIKGTKVYTIKIKLSKKNVLRKAVRYRGYVRRYSEKYRLEPALVFAIIHTESSFNPLARSPIPAYGLMQIVPETAGKDATKIIYGRPVLLSPSYLYNGKNNILVGTSYFYLLYYKYFGKVKDPRSRLYCSIAAYNTGVGNVARAITGTTNLKKAIKKINQMSSEEVYEALMKNVPLETKNYLRKILKRRKMYAKSGL